MEAGVMFIKVEQVAVLPLASVTVHTTVEVPVGKVNPARLLPE